MLLLLLIALPIQSSQGIEFDDSITVIQPWVPVSKSNAPRLPDPYLHGLYLFDRLIKKHCNLTEKFVILSPQAYSPKSSNLFSKILKFILQNLQIYSPKTEKPHFLFKEKPNADSPLAFLRNTFQYYQYPLYRFLKHHPQIAKRSHKKEISLILVKELSDHCAFSFPRVQFPSTPTSPREKEIISLLTNRIILALSPHPAFGCHNRRRLVAHELAHIFIQDDPKNPHTCLMNGELHPCPPTNLLANFAILWESPHRFYSSNSMISLPLQATRFMQSDDLFPEEVLATGTDITPEQCDQIEQSLQ